MNNYIFLTNQYLPKPGATGLCVHQLAKNLSMQGHNVWTVCYADNDTNESFDGVKIKKIIPPRYLNDNQSVSSFKRKVQYICSLLSKFVHIRQYPLRSKRLIKEYCNAIEEILPSSKEATIVASYTPLEAVIAAMIIKEKYDDIIRSVYYSTDTLSNEQGYDGILPAKYRSKCGFKWEKRLFDSYDKIIIMECHKDHYHQNVFNEYENKMVEASFPLFSKFEYNRSEEIQGDKLRLVYAGTLYKKLRNPVYMNKILVELSKIIDMEAVFLGGGDCEELMQIAELESDYAIRYIGMQEHSVAIQYIASADILLSIGNVESPMAPSKIFEYMSTGKPIIHTYTYDKDPCLEPLKRYGNALLIKENDIDIEQVAEFISSMKIMDYNDVEKLFITSTPEYTANIIVSS